ncbi:unnamed protein product [Onchocerca flexuosa]|uniref:Transmembrane protein 106A n=1 Tax=Onchocerca flexuosa TaxID=387005 RepID=A0A183I0H9_9BILA|nr:unnamed protein product [Onchocerca flexuosa]
MNSVIEGTRNLMHKMRHRFISGNSTGDHYSSFDSTVNLANECATPSRANSMGYTELMEGSVPCPSCKGSGRIPKELEETLVALIPVNDDRLKPKRTWLYVFGVVLGCISLAGVVIFLLVPRAIYLSSIRPPVEIITVFDHDKNHITVLEIISYFQKSSALTDHFYSEYCQAPFSLLISLYVNMQFDISVTLEYLSHREQATLSVVQQVCCVPSGNCTAAEW